MRVWHFFILFFVAVISYHIFDPGIATLFTKIPPFAVLIAAICSNLVSPFANLCLWSISTLISVRLNLFKSLAFNLLQITFMCGFVMFFTGILKILIGRARPELFLEAGIYGSYTGVFDHLYRSFPSSHSAIAFGLATLLTIYTRQNTKLIYRVALGLSLLRVVTNQHYLSDVIIGGIMGYYIARLVYYYTEKHKELIVKWLNKIKPSRNRIGRV